MHLYILSLGIHYTFTSYYQFRNLTREVIKDPYVNIDLDTDISGRKVSQTELSKTLLQEHTHKHYNKIILFTKGNITDIMRFRQQSPEIDLNTETGSRIASKLIQIMESTPNIDNQAGKPVDVSNSFIFNKDLICLICMERPARIPYDPHSTPQGQVCKPPPLCAVCCKLCTKCIYCKIDNPPHDPNYHLIHLKSVIKETLELLYIKTYPRVTHIEDDEEGFHLNQGDISHDYVSYKYLGQNDLIRIFWFIQFYYDYTDKEYKYDQSRYRPTILHKQRPPSCHNRTFTHLNQKLVRYIYESLQQDYDIIKTPKYAILKCIITIFDTFTESELSEIIKPRSVCMYQSDIELFSDVDKFKSAVIDPRFYTNAQSLGIPINLNKL